MVSPKRNRGEKRCENDGSAGELVSQKVLLSIVPEYITNSRIHLKLGTLRKRCGSWWLKTSREWPSC